MVPSIPVRLALVLLVVSSFMSLLIAGGKLDPNLSRLVAACEALSVPFIECRHGQGESPAFEWQAASGIASIDGRFCIPRGAFLRHDVFEGLDTPSPKIGMKALAWHQAVNGWLLSQPSIRIFNRNHLPVSLSKPATLIAARQAGLVVPLTEVTNLEPSIRAASELGSVTKPVAGGDYCYFISDILEGTEFRNQLASCPAFIQPRLVAPEVRVYVIGSYDFAFEMRSPSLDYRVHQDAEVVPMPKVPDVISGLRKLMTTLQMDYGAADFKTDPETGDLMFLELNTSPMFARFDMEVNGTLAQSIVRTLLS